MKLSAILLPLLLTSCPQAVADEILLGFNPASDYPSRDTTYDGYLAPTDGLSQETLNRLFTHVAMPQSEAAMVSLLGWPTSYQGNIQYWPIAGGSSELAMTVIDGQAISYTVGY
jgi:hypothetical protein